MADRSNELRDLLAKYIRENSLKNTRQREAIFEAFLSCEGHVTIDVLLA